jgi:hypothetical protein
MIRPLTRKDYVKSVLVGLLTTILSLIASAIILVTILAASKRELSIGPLYLLIPIVTFAVGFYWSLRRSSRHQILNRPPSTVAVIAKSTAVGLTAVIVSVIAYVMWIWMRLPPTFHGSFGFDLHRLIYWPVMLAVFLAGFLLEYRRASRRRSVSGAFR